MKKDAPPILVKKCKEDGYVLFPNEYKNGSFISIEDRLKLHEIYPLCVSYHLCVAINFL